MEKIEFTPVLSSVPLQPAQLTAPNQNVEYFQQLLTGMKKTLGQSASSLEAKPAEESSEQAAPSLLAASAVELNKAEYYINRLELQVRRGVHQFEGGHTMDGNYAKAISQQQFASAYYFLGVNRVGNSAEDISEEVGSVTRRR